MEKHHKFSMWYVVLGVWGVLLIQNYISSMYVIPTIPYSQFLKFLKENKVAEVAITADRIQGKVKEEGLLPRKATNFRTVRVDPETSRLLDQYNVTFKGEVESTFFRTLLSWIVPVLIFFGVWALMMKRMMGQQPGFMTLGKNKAKIYVENELNVTFNDVAGVDEAKQELVEVVEFLKEPGRFTEIGGKMPKGVLLVGPPGAGKTLLAKAVAGESGVPFFSLSGSEFVEMFVGLGAARVRDLFVQAKQKAPCIIFIDELDALGKARGFGAVGGHDEREQTLNQLLVEMDGFESNDGVILIAATNRPDVLDPALLRPGRFDRRVVVSLPDVRGRRGILAVHTRTVPVDPDVDLERLAKGTPGLSGADLENLVNEAALLASRRDREAVVMLDFEEAKDKVMLGAERRSMVMTEEDKRLSSVHEAGHALVAKLVPGAPPINKAVIVPRGQSMGMVSFLAEERHSVTESKLKAHLATALGGCCAESIVFGERSTGAQADYKQVTALARSMVCDWGMNQSLGPLSLGSEDDEIFLGKEFTRTRNFSEQTAQTIDREIRELVIEAERRATEVLEGGRDHLEALAAALLEYEVLDDAEIELIMAGKPLPRDPVAAENGADEPPAGGNGGPVPEREGAPQGAEADGGPSGQAAADA